MRVATCLLLAVMLYIYIVPDPLLAARLELRRADTADSLRHTAQRNPITP